MELALQRYAQETKQAVLLESKCLELVPNFHFNEANFKAALNYLHKIKHIYYYESGLKGLVVADIAVIQNKLSEVVSFSIELCNNPSGCIAVGHEWIKFGERGILHISCLDRFPSHYIEDVFTPKDLLQLFTSLCIVSQLNSDEYLMPCVLPVEEKAFCKPETQSVPAMVVEFPDGGPMLGLFCGLVCYLINTDNWKIATNMSREPLHITRSSVHFSDPDFNKVTINDPLSTFFMVTFHGDRDEASQACPRIRETILTGIEEVSKNLHYLGKDKADSVDTHPMITFLCCSSEITETTPLHPAKRTSTGKLKCPHFCGSSSVPLSAGHKTWLEGEHEQLLVEYNIINTPFLGYESYASTVSPPKPATSSGGHGGMYMYYPCYSGFRQSCKFVHALKGYCAAQSFEICMRSSSFMFQNFARLPKSAVSPYLSLLQE